MKIGFRKLILGSVFTIFFITIITIFIIINIVYQISLEKKFIDENDFAIGVAKDTLQKKKDEIGQDSRTISRNLSLRFAVVNDQFIIPTQDYLEREKIENQKMDKLKLEFGK